MTTCNSTKKEMKGEVAEYSRAAEIGSGPQFKENRIPCKGERAKNI